MFKKKKAKFILFTGMPCSGKSTIADKLEQKFNNKGINNIRLDGDIIRDTLWRDLKFSKEDRKENLRRIANVGKMFINKGVWVLASFVSPYQEVREMMQEIIGEVDFIEVFVNASSIECANRDVKGMWAKAKSGEIKGFTGYDAPYEPPSYPQITCLTNLESVEKSTDIVFKYLRSKKLI